MRKQLILLAFASSFSVLLFAQIGVRAGLNFANVTNASSINNDSRSGFNVGVFLAPPSKGIISSRTELVFSRQGYNYKTQSNTGDVSLDYIMLPQYMGINITKYVQLQFGAHMAFLVSAKADSSTGNGSSSENQMMDMMNRFDYGYGGGIEIHPVAGLLIGARITVGMGDLYSQPEQGQGGQMQMPSFIPNIDVKNNLVQIYAGWTFGKKNESKKKKDKSE